MNIELPQLYFERDVDWYDWLLNNQENYHAIYLIFYKLDTGIPSMRWEEAVKVALCFGWIDSTVKSLGNGKRQQYFCKRKPKSPWSKLNKTYIEELTAKNLLQESGWISIEIAKKNGMWNYMDDIDNEIIPNDLQDAFNLHPVAFENYQNFAPGYRKSYLSWLHSAKRIETKQKRIKEIIQLCSKNIKTR